MVSEAKTTVVSEKCRKLLKESLLIKRAEKEKSIQDLSAELTQLGVQKQEFDKRGSQYVEECDKVQIMINTAFSQLKKINLVLDALEKGTFTGICESCKECIPEEELLGNQEKDIPANPTRKLCISCQQKKNTSK